MTTILFLSLSMLMLFNLNLFWPLILSMMSMTFIFSLKFMLCSIFSTSYISSFMFIDTISSLLISLTIWISILMILSSFKILNNQQASSWFSILVILLMMILMIAFSSNNLFMFYIFFEASLIPTLLLILTWGYQPERTQASFYLMMYTVIASLPLLLNLININTIMKSSSILIMYSQYSPCFSKLMMWLFIILAFLVKIPMFLTHLWLPKAHVEAPVAGSMILAAILLKLGGYGLIRFSFMFHNMNISIYPILSSVSMWGCVLASMICVRQTDMKSLIAYSSVSHMALLISGILNQSFFGLFGGMLMMIAHGLSSSLLFMIANMTYEKTNTRSLILSKGILLFSPIFSMFWFLSCMSNMAGPPSLNLVSEIFLINSISISSLMFLFILMPSLFLSACYSLILYSSLNHGNAPHFSNPTILLSQRNLLCMTLHLIPIFILLTTIPMMMPM